MKYVLKDTADEYITWDDVLWRSKMKNEEGEEVKCCVCGEPATAYYIEREDCPSCESAVCELQMQYQIDEQDGFESGT